MNRLQYVCLLVVLGATVATTGFAGTVAGTERTLTSQPDSAALDTGAVLSPAVEVGIGDDAGDVDVTAVYDASSGFVVDLGSLPGSVTVTDTVGFEAVGDGRYRATGTATAPTVEYVVTLENPRTITDDGPEALAPGPWVLVRPGVVVPAVEGARSAVDLEPAGPGYGTSTWIFVGEVETYTRTVEGEQITLVVPDAAAPVSRPATILAHLETTNRHIDVGGRSEHVHVLALPSIDIGTPWAGVKSGYGDVIVHAARPVATEPSTWAHEYAHTRQKFGTTSETKWLTEASADYFAGYETLQQDRLDYPGFERQSGQQQFQRAVLADPSTWDDDELVPYIKGERALAHLDEQIRVATDGERALADVFRRLNGRSGTVSLEAFYRTVEEVSTPQIAAEFRRYVETPEYAPSPRNESNYVEPIPDDPDRDGLSNAAEIEAGTAPFDADTDDDGLTDHRELTELETAPVAADTDGDGRSDAVELTHPRTDPSIADTDDDGVSDSREIELAADPTVADTDGDGLTDGREVEIGTSLRYADADGDGLEDATEVDLGTDPKSVDTDGDGLSDRAEREGPTEPTAVDTDGDGYGDAAELDLGTDPAAPTDRTPYLRAYARAFLSGLLD